MFWTVFIHILNRVVTIAVCASVIAAGVPCPAVSAPEAPDENGVAGNAVSTAARASHVLRDAIPIASFAADPPDTTGDDDFFLPPEKSRKKLVQEVAVFVIVSAFVAYFIITVFLKKDNPPPPKTPTGKPVPLPQ